MVNFKAYKATSNDISGRKIQNICSKWDKEDYWFQAVVDVAQTLRLTLRDLNLDAFSGYFKDELFSSSMVASYVYASHGANYVWPSKKASVYVVYHA